MSISVNMHGLTGVKGAVARVESHGASHAAVDLCESNGQKVTLFVNTPETLEGAAEEFKRVAKALRYQQATEG
ncbi:hypothetical protein N9112_00405 [bacterium]|nr:hypothetical protein [bacterium]